MMRFYNNPFFGIVYNAKKVTRHSNYLSNGNLAYCTVLMECQLPTLGVSISPLSGYNNGSYHYMRARHSGDCHWRFLLFGKRLRECTHPEYVKYNKLYINALDSI